MEETNNCHICNHETEWECRDCEYPVCESCTVEFTQFNQVDYTLCNKCYSSHQESAAEEYIEREKWEKEHKYELSLSPEELEIYRIEKTFIPELYKNINKKLGN